MRDITGSSTPCARAVSKMLTSGCPLRWRLNRSGHSAHWPVHFNLLDIFSKRNTSLRTQIGEYDLAVGAVGGSSAHGKAHSAANQDFFSFGSLERHVERGPIGFEKCSACPKIGKEVERMAAGLGRWSRMECFGIPARDGFGLKRYVMDAVLLFEHFCDGCANRFACCLRLKHQMRC